MQRNGEKIRMPVCTTMGLQVCIRWGSSLKCSGLMAHGQVPRNCAGYIVSVQVGCGQDEGKERRKR